jgi:hypothetical protein
LEWIAKVHEIIRLPTKYFLLVAIITGALLFLPKPVLTRLHLDSMPDPYGAIIGVVFLVTIGLVILNASSWVWGRIDSERRLKEHKDAILKTLMSLDPAEQSVLREFFVGAQSTVTMPLDNPVVAGLIARGILQQVGSLGHYSFHGAMFSFRMSESAEELITPKILGLSKFKIPNNEGKWMVNDEGIEWIDGNRPEFTSSRRW